MRKTIYLIACATVVLGLMSANGIFASGSVSYRPGAESSSSSGEEGESSLVENERPEDVIEVSDVDSMALNVADAFLRIPSKDMDILAPSQRNDMVIYMMADSIYKCRNIYTGQSWIEKMTPDYMRVHLTDVSSLQLKILPSDKKAKLKQRLVMSIYTIAGESETADSTIKFYNLTEYTPDSITLTEVASRKYFILPDPKRFYNVAKIKSEGLNLKSLMNEMPFYTVAYEISADRNVLTGRLTMDNYLTTEQRDKMNPLLIKTLRWHWNGSKFQIE
ncbi:MAG: DUF3256 family protein [Muribaculaceae bacterium]|nr:DUF3256 family protein [Muribaculaceae bacterium]